MWGVGQATRGGAALHAALDAKEEGRRYKPILVLAALHAALDAASIRRNVRAHKDVSISLSITSCLSITL